MEEIYEPNSTFDFNKLTLSPPTSILGGNYFIKFNILGNPLYIQSPKCTTKSGIAKAGKKLYCDLMMSNDHSNFIQWLENLENYSQECIFANRAKWFETELEKHDIENSFASPVKTYKSGKFYITRTNVPTSLGKCSLKIYDENENTVELDQIKDTTDIITILEIQGIKCSVRSFQIEIELKQMMVVKPSKLFEKCIIKTQSHTINELVPHISQPNITNILSTSTVLDHTLALNNEYVEPGIEEDPESDVESEDIFKTRKPILKTTNLVNSTDQVIDPIINPIVDPIINPIIDPIIKLTDPFEMTEIELSLDELPENETVQIKKRNDVYYQMYRDAKKKAKLARDLALSTYLDAKRIKNTYMLDELDESDLDEDEMKFQEDE